MCTCSSHGMLYNILVRSTVEVSSLRSSSLPCRGIMTQELTSDMHIQADTLLVQHQHLARLQHSIYIFTG